VLTGDGKVEFRNGYKPTTESANLFWELMHATSSRPIELDAIIPETTVVDKEKGVVQFRSKLGMQYQITLADLRKLVL